MIPEQYWGILRRWFWLVLLLGAAGGVVGLFIIPMGLSGGSSYNASVTLGVGRFVSVSGTVADATQGGGGSALADYTSSIAATAKSVQFVARLREALAAKGLVVTDTVLREKFNVTEDSALFRIRVEATATTADKAELVAQTVADALTEQAASEEQRISENLVQSSDQQRQELATRLADAYQRRLARFNALGGQAVQAAQSALMQRAAGGADLGAEFSEVMQDVALISGDTELALINAEVKALEDELASLSKVQQSFSDLGSWGQPVFVLNPVDTVPTEVESTLRKRDMAVLGGGAGLIMGWIAANMAEHIRNGRGPRRDEEDGEAEL